MSHFEQYLAEVATPGNRYAALPRLVASGKGSGMSDDEIVERVRAVGVLNRDTDIRRLWRTSTATPAAPGSARRPGPPALHLTAKEREERRRLLLPKAARQFVSVTLQHYGRTPFEQGGAFTGRGTADILGEKVRLSDAELHWDEATYRRQAAFQLRVLFRPGDLVWAGWIVKDEADRARLGLRRAKTPLKPWPALFRDGGRDAWNSGIHGIYDAHDLAAAIEGGLVKRIPPLVSLNPLTGAGVERPNDNDKGTHLSFDCGETVARRLYALAEWDELFELDAQGVKTPSQAQIDVVAGLTDYAFEHDNHLRVVAATYTGHRSIHCVLRVKADDAAGYERQTAQLRDLLASADDAAYRTDPHGLDKGYGHIRLAGAFHPKTGRRARLLMTDAESWPSSYKVLPPSQGAG